MPCRMRLYYNVQARTWESGPKIVICGPSAIATLLRRASSLLPNARWPRGLTFEGMSQASRPSGAPGNRVAGGQQRGGGFESGGSRVWKMRARCEGLYRKDSMRRGAFPTRWSRIAVRCMGSNGTGRLRNGWPFRAVRSALRGCRRNVCRRDVCRRDVCMYDIYISNVYNKARAPTRGVE